MPQASFRASLRNRRACPEISVTFVSAGRTGSRPARHRWGGTGFRLAGRRCVGRPTKEPGQRTRPTYRRPNSSPHRVTWEAERVNFLLDSNVVVELTTRAKPEERVLGGALR